MTGRALCFEHAGQNFGSRPRPPGIPPCPRWREERPGMKEPQEIADEEYEQVVERVAAVDVAKASGMVCTRVPDPSRPGRRRTRVWEVAATTNAVLDLGAHLAGEGIEKVTLESASDYWRIWFYLLEAAGLQDRGADHSDPRRPGHRCRRHGRPISRHRAGRTSAARGDQAG